MALSRTCSSARDSSLPRGGLGLGRGPSLRILGAGPTGCQPRAWVAAFRLGYWGARARGQLLARGGGSLLQRNLLQERIWSQLRSAFASWARSWRRVLLGQKGGAGVFFGSARRGLGCRHTQSAADPAAIQGAPAAGGPVFLVRRRCRLRWGRARGGHEVGGRAFDRASGLPANSAARNFATRIRWWGWRRSFEAWGCERNLPRRLPAAYAFARRTYIVGYAQRSGRRRAVEPGTS